MKATMNNKRMTIPCTFATGVLLAASLTAPAEADTFVWSGSANDGVWQAGASETNWVGGSYNPAPGVANEYVFLDPVAAVFAATEQITLQGGHQPVAQFMHFDENFGTAMNITVDGTGGSKLVWVPNSTSLGNGETVRVEPGFNASIDAINGGTVELSGGRTDMLIGNNGVLRIDAPVIGTANNSRFLVTGQGLLVLTSDSSTYTGGVHSQANIDFTSVGNIGQTSSLGTGDSGDIRIGSPFQTVSQIRYIGEGIQTTNREIVVVRGREEVTDARLLSTQGTLVLTGGIRQNRNEDFISRLRMGGNIEVRDTGISGGFDLHKISTGTLTLATANTYEGETRLYAGNLRLEADNALPQDSNLWLRGGVLEVADITLDLGTLELFGNASNTITADQDTPFNISFANSSAINWTGTLDILNWTDDTLLRFGTDATGLTSSQLSMISIDGQQAIISGDGYISQIPEPGTFITLAGLGGAMLMRRRRTLSA